MFITDAMIVQELSIYLSETTTTIDASILLADIFAKIIFQEFLTKKLLKNLGGFKGI